MRVDWRGIVAALSTVTDEYHSIQDYFSALNDVARMHIPIYADEWLKLGNSDEPKAASAEKGEKLFQLAVNGLVVYLEDFTRFEPKYGWHERI